MLSSGTEMEILNVFLHGINTVSCLLDIMITARPIRIHHFYLAIIFGLYYTTFSVLYWAAGGEGICAPRCHQLAVNSSLGSDDLSCPDECDPYIYPILDWDGNPGLAAGMVVGSCIMMPILQTGWWAVCWVRAKLKQTCWS